MKISETYSHLNGLEYLLVHKTTLWEEILTVISQVDAQACKTKISKEKTMQGKLAVQPGSNEPSVQKITVPTKALMG